MQMQNFTTQPKYSNENPQQRKPNIANEPEPRIQNKRNSELARKALIKVLSEYQMAHKSSHS